MTTHSSASVREPHVNRTTRTATIINALKQRAQAVLNDRTIDPQSRAVIRYALETNDPWLAELVRRADAREEIVDAIDFSETPESFTSEEITTEEEDKITALAQVICRAGNEARTKSAALVVLMATLENATHPKALANIAKHAAFTCCGELDFNGMVEAQVALLERELFGGEIVDC